jgi:hypothetical protein
MKPLEDVFSLVSAISKTKKDYFRGATEIQAKALYNPYMVNKALSYHIDTILYANEMNSRSQLDKLLQHDYLINTIRSRSRRPEKWPKPFESKDIQTVMEYYGCNYNRAKEYMMILTQDQLSIIHDRTFKGGSDDTRYNRDGRGTTKES